jgi:hypothetical protein
VRANLVSDMFVVPVYKKHYPPALHDEVWRLDKIGKDGAFHKRLNVANIITVEDFLRLVVMDPQRLRNVMIPANSLWLACWPWILFVAQGSFFGVSSVHCFHIFHDAEG